MPDLSQQLADKETQITAQLDRIYALIRTGDVQSIIEVEYRRAVERITEKYELLQQVAHAMGSSLSPAQVQERIRALQQQYQNDVVFLAAAIDDAIKQRDVKRL
jgi:hypothetical protein